MSQQGKQIIGKKGISPMIAYIILISIAVVIGGITYQWLRTYVPRDVQDCPGGVSVFVESYDYDCTTNTLQLNLENNGLFSIRGFFISAGRSSVEEVATEDLSSYYQEQGDLIGNIVALPIPPGSQEENPFLPKSERSFTFQNIPATPQIKLIEIIPVRFQEVKNSQSPVSCSSAKIKQEIECTP